MPDRFHGFPGKLHHHIPPWVEDGALFHIRLRALSANLTAPVIAHVLLDSVRFYEQRRRWYPLVGLLMPDHLHALLAFPGHENMSQVIGSWKSFHAKRLAVRWQDGYFDHRLRDDERGEQLTVQIDYILQNPVAASLCSTAADWPWVYQSEGGS